MQPEPPVPQWLLAILKVPRTVIQFVFRGPFRPLLDWVHRQLYRIGFHFAAHEVFDGNQLYCMESDDAEMFFATCTQALRLLQTHDERRYQRVKKYLKNIALFSSGYGHFDKTTSSFIVNSFDFYHPTTFASNIVHEATHGLLNGKGLKYESSEKRHETICSREQIRSLRRLSIKLNPNITAEQLAELDKAWKEWMESGLRDEWWDPHKLLQKGAARLISITHEESTTPQDVYVVVREIIHSHNFIARNSTPYDVTVTIRHFGIENGDSKGLSPWTKSLAPKSQVTAFAIAAVNPNEPVKYQYNWNWKFGIPGTKHDDSYCYALPFDRKLLTQNSDSQNGSSHWDLPIGSPILAAREGIVVRISEQTASTPGQIMVKHTDGSLATYRGFGENTICLKPDQQIAKADRIGTVGNKDSNPSTTFYFYVWIPIDGEQVTYVSVKFDLPT